jgi:CRISPR-associated protein Cmr2
MKENTIYTAITFAPVQGFIEKSRKLRDLYGSSYLLSFLAEVICRAVDAESNCVLISPALVNNTKGTPNQILIEGEFPQAKEIFFETWQIIVKTCQTSIEKYYLADENYQWERAWNAWGNYAWEFFSATNQEINTVRQKLSEIKRERNWIGINWQGESSSLTGHDGGEHLTFAMSVNTYSNKRK